MARMKRPVAARKGRFFMELSYGKTPHRGVFSHYAEPKSIIKSNSQLEVGRTSLCVRPWRLKRLFRLHEQTDEAGGALRVAVKLLLQLRQGQSGRKVLRLQIRRRDDERVVVR